ncbi:MAG: thioredoxin [Candidatus Latescibacteria bacterium]|nr:thioredoxin [Candidatus Latescibacterota bacterium]
MANLLEVTDDTFDEKVLKSSIPVVVDFWAEWCPPCKMIAPFLVEIAAEYEGKVLICKVNVDDNHNLAQKYGIRSIPTLLYIKQGKIEDQVVGALPKEQLAEHLIKLL